jgi:hypothetical protein
LKSTLKKYGVESLLTDKQLDSRARRAAKRAGLIAHKSRFRVGTFNNHGGFMLITPTRHVVAGERFNMTAEEVIEFCKDLFEQVGRELFRQMAEK